MKLCIKLANLRHLLKYKIISTEFKILDYIDLKKKLPIISPKINTFVNDIFIKLKLKIVLLN